MTQSSLVEVSPDNKVRAYNQGTIDRYSAKELELLDNVVLTAKQFQEKRLELLWSLSQLKDEMDATDQANGIVVQSGASKSRFWDGIERGDMGEYWKGVGRSTIKDGFMYVACCQQVTKSIQSANGLPANHQITGRAPADKNPLLECPLSQEAAIAYNALPADAKQTANICHPCR